MKLFNIFFILILFLTSCGNGAESNDDYLEEEEHLEQKDHSEMVDNDSVPDVD